jgi:APA family basic amino acid/polyamine antiporter
MAEKTTGEMQATLGLTGLDDERDGAHRPRRFPLAHLYSQATEGATAPSMWIGIVFALLLCLATAVCYAEMAKLYPGTGSSYYFAEQSFLNHDKAWRYARLSKFIVGWGSHLYYWIYPGVMVAVTGIFCGYVVGTLWPNFMSASNPGPMFMMLVAVSSPSVWPTSHTAESTVPRPSASPSTSFRSPR